MSVGSASRIPVGGQFRIAEMPREGIDKDGPLITVTGSITEF
jgi:hypothetical protein